MSEKGTAFAEEDVASKVVITLVMFLAVVALMIFVVLLVPLQMVRAALGREKWGDVLMTPVRAGWNVLMTPWLIVQMWQGKDPSESPDEPTEVSAGPTEPHAAAGVADLFELAAQALGVPVATTFAREFRQLQQLLRHADHVVAVTVAYHGWKSAPFVVTRTRCLVVTKTFFRREYETRELSFSPELVFRVRHGGGRNILTEFSAGGGDVYEVNFAPDTPNRPALVRQLADLVEAAGGKAMVERKLDK